MTGISEGCAMTRDDIYELLSDELAHYEESDKLTEAAIEKLASEWEVSRAAMEIRLGYR